MYLNSRGYVVPKDSISQEEIISIKNELSVKPFVIEGYGNSNVDSFKTYLESNTKLYLPKYYGLNKFGVPESIKINEGEDINVEFTGKLRELQEEAVKVVLDACKDPKKMGGILCLQCGQGKCLAKDTELLMYDGTLKKVQDILIDDLLMGDDSRPRRVLSTCSGKELMYRITQSRGKSYVVNQSHILSLKNIQNGEVIDISIIDYIKFPNKNSLKGFKVPVDFSSKVVDLDPYLFGYWLGNSYVNNLTLEIKNAVVLKYLTDVLEKYDCDLCFNKNFYYILGRGNSNYVFNFLISNKLLINPHILHTYKCNSYHIRYELLAGIIDSSGYSKDGKYYVITMNKKLKQDITYLATSLGFYIYEENYKLVIQGKLSSIPSKLHKLKDHNEDILLSDIQSEELEKDDYYGFEIDGNRRFLLNDFTVTHNTISAISMICTLAKKTLIIVHKEFLLDQWRERINEFAPGARIGIIKAQKLDIENKDIVIASLQSLAMKDYSDDIFKPFGNVVIDECHHTGAQVFSQALKKINFKYSIGLTATPRRKDGLTKVFIWFLGDIAFQSKKRKDNLEVRFESYYESDQNYSKLHLLYNNKPNVAKMINNICEYLPRVNFIADQIESILDEEPNRKILVLSDRREHLHKIKEYLDYNEISSGFYYGGLSAFQLKESESKTVLLATFQYASEGFDMKGLDTLILASPKSDVIQVTGRILRDKPEDRKHKPLIIDIVDNFSLFYKQGEKRYKYYKTCKYDIVNGEIFKPVQKTANLPLNQFLINYKN